MESSWAASLRLKKEKKIVVNSVFETSPSLPACLPACLPVNVSLLLGVEYFVAVSADVFPDIVVDITDVFLVVVPRVVDNVTLNTFGRVVGAPYLAVLGLGLVSVLFHAAMHTQEFA